MATQLAHDGVLHVVIREADDVLHDATAKLVQRQAVVAAEEAAKTKRAREC